MKISVEGRFRQAVRAACAAGVACTSATGTNAIAQENAASTEATKLDKVEVTGSRIRRVDAETASPIFTIDRVAIKASGVQTLGELIQELPSIAGNATSTRVNNGGGTGASEISLRGLGEDRTLILLNGRRMVTQDVNAIPINMIERVEVLKEGASAVYGSDAIAGVINFITRRDFTGGEAAIDYGISAQGDGKRKGVQLSWGASTATANILIGMDYNDQDEISAADRDFSAFATYFYSGAVQSIAGSSRAPRGRISLPSDQFESIYDCIPAGETVPAAISVTRIPGSTGASQSDFRCFGADPNVNDRFNFQAVGNVVLTPQERAGLFAIANVKVADQVEAYTEVFHNNTKSRQAIAPLPFDARLDDVVISSDSVFNPFGISFGGADGANPNALFRLESLGNRRSAFQTNDDQINLGLRGEIGNTSWNWDAGVSYGRATQSQTSAGYLFQPPFVAGLGPSFDSDPGPAFTPVCGTPGPDPNNPSAGATVVAGCTPVNIFNLSDPGQLAALNSFSAGYGVDQTDTLKGGGINFSGTVVNLPAGALSLAVGYARSESRLTSQVDFVAQAQAPDFLNCQISQETCTNATNGHFEVDGYYAEALVPVLADAPGAKVLNVILGTRYSDYSNFGGTTNSKIGLEWRPIGDLLARASYSEVFRAPTIGDLFDPKTANAPTFNDPCVGLTEADVTANPNLALACENVVRDGTFDPANSQITGLLQGNPDLKPEQGDVLTFGAVYDPNWLPGFSTAVDFWRYDLEDTIESLDVNTIAAQCASTGETQFCDLIQRFPDGTVQVIQQPSDNLGLAKSEGVDVGLKYRLANTPFGRFKFSLDTTYINKDDRTPDAKFPDSVEHLAGKWSRQYGNFSRVRSIANINWAWQGLDILWTARYLHGFTIPDADGSPLVTPLSYGSTTYHGVTIGYTVPKIKTKLLIGADNIFDKQPPILFQNNVINANTDVETFDTVGTYFFARITQNF